MALSSALDFNNHFLNQIIYHSIQNNEFLKKIRPVVPKSIFKTREKEYLINIIFQYYDEYKTAPHDNFFDIFKEHEKSMGQDLYERCINLIKLLKDITGSNPEYILNSLNDAIRHFRLEEASVEFASLLKNKKYDDAKFVILKAMKEPSIDTPYYDFLSDRTFIEPRLKDNIIMVTKIKKLDEIITGFRPSWLINILGATKAGKTWMFIELALAGLLQGLNVLYISLEMGKEVIDDRFDMAIGFMTSAKNGKNQEILRKVGNNWQTVKQDVDSIHEIDKVIKNRQRIRKNSSGSLKIIAFDRGRMNYLDINRVMDELEETEGFFTNLLVVDYLAMMKETTPGQTKKDRITENCIGLKEMASIRKMAVVSGMQGNRQAMKAKVFHSYLVADDIDTIFNSDLVLALCQTDTEEKENRYRIYIANNRHGKQHAQIGVIRDLGTGQVALDSFEILPENTENKNNQEPGVDY